MKINILSHDFLRILLFLSLYYPKGEQKSGKAGQFASLLKITLPQPNHNKFVLKFDMNYHRWGQVGNLGHCKVSMRFLKTYNRSY